jgi:hypothetical protein
VSVVVIVESIVLVVLGLFTVALLASYSGLYRRLQHLEDDPRSSARDGASRSLGTGTGTGTGRDTGNGIDRARVAVDLVGVTPMGDDALVAVAGVEHGTLLAFLSSSCATCGRFWDALRTPRGVRLPQGVRLVVVTKGPEEESPAALGALVRDEVEVVMSTDAWRHYEVPGSPYFVYVHGPSSSVGGRGTALGWPEVVNLMAMARGDDALGGAARSRSARAPRSSREREREREVDEVLLAAGITPGHPSLYPRREPPEQVPQSARPRSS